MADSLLKGIFLKLGIGTKEFTSVNSSPKKNLQSKFCKGINVIDEKNDTQLMIVQDKKGKGFYCKHGNTKKEFDEAFRKLKEAHIFKEGKLE